VELQEMREQEIQEIQEMQELLEMVAQEEMVVVVDLDRALEVLLALLGVGLANLLIQVVESVVVEEILEAERDLVEEVGLDNLVLPDLVGEVEAVLEMVDLLVQTELQDLQEHLIQVEQEEQQIQALQPLLL
jgi:hypothetical protein